MQPCPQQVSNTMVKTHDSHWRDDGTCSYCGSMKPETVFAAIEAGFKLTPTDKNYKVYVQIPNARAGERSVRSMCNSFMQGYTEVTAENIDTIPNWPMRPKIGDYVQVGVESSMTTGKFYFEHFSEEDKHRFIQLLNDKKIQLESPGYFYRLPFFCRIEDKK